MGKRDTDRLRRRVQTLRNNSAQYASALHALRQAYSNGARTRAQVTIRRSLILCRMDTGTSASTRLPSPVANLVTQKGWALHLYLIAIFEAQFRRPPGQQVQNTRALRGTAGQPGWVDLLPATTTTADQTAGAMRQMKRALTLLSQENLVRLSGPAGSANRFERFQLLDESGRSDRSGRCEPYYFMSVAEEVGPLRDDRPVAAKAGQVLTMPIPNAFFLNGWVHVLSAAEIVVYLMIRDLETRYPQAAKSGVFVASRGREDWYGISRDEYESHRRLAAYGLIERLEDPHRGADGKILRQPGGRTYLPAWRFRSLADGLERPAHKTMIAALTKT